MRWLCPTSLAAALLLTACSQPRQEAKSATTAQPTSPAPVVAAKPPPVSCARGLGDCDGQRENGCEATLDDNPEHCGSCEQACAAEGRCIAGSCQQGVVALSAGGSHTCALMADGKVACWGLNALGQLGLPKRRARLSPVVLPGIEGARSVAAGRYHTCVLLADGKVQCSGDGGMLGNGMGRPHAGFMETLEVVDAVAIATGMSHNCVLLRDGSAKCWGSDVMGQLGNGEPPPEPVDKKKKKKDAADDNEIFAMVPLPVNGLQDAIALEVGGAQSCALHRGGTVSCWGQGSFGQLGNGEVVDRHEPTPIPGLLDVVELSLGQFHSCARTKRGELYCWGRNNWGQLGLGDHLDRSAPTKLELPEIAELSAGLHHTCARLHSGKVLCWGANQGRVGDGTQDDRDRPAEVSGLDDAIAIDAGEVHTCALRRSGELSCWGDNDGQLGTGDRVASAAPVALSWRPGSPTQAQGMPQ